MKIQISIEAEPAEIKELLFNQTLDAGLPNTRTLSDSQNDDKIHNWEMLKRSRRLQRLYLDNVEPIEASLLTDQSEQQ